MLNKIGYIVRYKILFMAIIVIITSGCTIIKPFMMNKSGDSVYLCRNGVGSTVQNDTTYGNAIKKSKHDVILYLVPQGNAHIFCRDVNASNAKIMGKIGSLVDRLEKYENTNKIRGIYVLNPDKTLTIAPYDAKQRKVLSIQ